MEDLLQIKNISLSRNHKTILNDISINIPKSIIINIYGSNGSGKTSFLKILAGITEHDNGVFKNDNLEIVYLGHKYGLKNNLTVYENLKLDCNNTGNLNIKNIDSSLDFFAMGEYKNTLVRYLSHGQQKKVALMRLLTIKSNLWILDEPYSALDRDGSIILEQLLTEAVKNNISVVMTNHTEINLKTINVKNYHLEDGRI